MAPETPSFEKAFERLEQILEAMNTGKTPLEESLKLFEEAEGLIRSCTKRLSSAEQKIELLIKSRSGEVVLDAEQKPRIENYTRTAAAPETPAPKATEPKPRVEAPVAATAKAPANYWESPPDSEPIRPAQPTVAPAPTWEKRLESAPEPRVASPVRVAAPPQALKAPASNLMDELPF